MGSGDEKSAVGVAVGFHLGTPAHPSPLADMAKYLRSFFVKDECHKSYTIGEKLGQGNFATVRQAHEQGVPAFHVHHARPLPALSR